VANVPIRLGLGVYDGLGQRANISTLAMIPEATSLTNLLVTLGDWATAVTAVSDGAVVRVEAAVLSSAAALSLPTSPGDEEMNEVGEFNYNLTGVPTTWTLAVPAIKDSMRSGDNIDITQTAIIALNTLLTSSLFTSGFFASPDEIKLASRKATFLGTRKHRRKLHALSYKLG
jgi:hypothetical protein